MNKTELISALSEKTELNKTQVAAVLNAFTETVKAEVVKGEDVVIANFVTFTSTEKAERTAKNPATGEIITIPAKRVPKVKFTKAFKDALL